MGYEFKLEALRRYRQHQEETLQKKMAKAQRHLETMMDRLSELLALRERTEEDLKQCQQQSATGQQMTMYLHFLKKLTKDIEQQQLIVAQQHQTCEQAREEVLNAMKKRKILEKLKEKEIQRYMRNLDQEEQKFINEMAINRYTLKHR
jgi:flagellar FliJ protein